MQAVKWWPLRTCAAMALKLKRCCKLLKYDNKGEMKGLFYSMLNQANELLSNGAETDTQLTGLFCSKNDLTCKSLATVSRNVCVLSWRAA
jgi:hypothetical protein